MPQVTKNKQYSFLYKSIYSLNATDQLISIKLVKRVLESRLLHVVLRRIEFL